MTAYSKIFSRAAALVVAGMLPFAVAGKTADAAPDSKAEEKASIPKDIDEYEFRAKRIVRLTGEIDDDKAAEIIRKLEYLDALGQQDIELRIQSYGGNVDAGLAIYDAIRGLKSDVRTVCEGAAQSMAGVLIAAGSPGKREARKNCRIMLHEPRSAPGYMTATQQRIYNDDMEFARRRMIKILSLHTGIPEDQMGRAIEQDQYMTPETAIERGVIDKITPYEKPDPNPPARAWANPSYRRGASNPAP